MATGGKCMSPENGSNKPKPLPHGSAALIRWLLENDLVDEMTLPIVPVVLGHGKRLLAMSFAVHAGLTIHIRSRSPRRSS
jgi:dihydrofolate reductase